MPRYYFDIHDSFVIRDHEGTDLPSKIDARVEGVRFTAAYLKDSPNLVWDGHQLRVLVFDEDRALLTTIHVSADDQAPMHEAVELEAKEDEPT